MTIDNTYKNHPIFDQLSDYTKFYGNLSFSIMSFTTMGTNSFLNIDTYIYSSMKGTLESIRDILAKGHISDAYALLRKFYDAATINIYSNLYLEDHFNLDNFVVEKINNWYLNKEKSPTIQVMNSYLQNSKKVKPIFDRLKIDKRYSNLRDRCNDNTHYNFYYNILLNNGEIYFENRLDLLNTFSKDLKNIFIYHLSYLFYIKDIYMMSSDYIDCLDCGIEPEPDSQYLVAPFIQDIFDKVIKKNRMDLFVEIKNNTKMKLE